MNKTGTKVFLVLISILMAVFIDYVFFLKYRAHFMKLNNNTHFQGPGIISSDLLKKVGYITYEKSSSFTNFKIQKSTYTYRIACFGDSGTYGSEVSDKLDFPFQLHREFKKAGNNNIEVLNFGCSGYGFFQSYFLWEAFWDKYNLDCIVLGPSCFQQERDSSFSGVTDLGPTQIHARYIISGPELKLLMPYGNDHEDSVKKYISFIPRWNYLRYDYKAPSFIRCLAPDYSIINNPFYYRKDCEKEIHTIYSKLLTNMGETAERFILLHEDEKIVKLCTFDHNDKYAGKPYTIASFPYSAKNFHKTGFGNNLFAKQVFNIFNNKKTCVYRIFRSFDADFSSSRETIISDITSLRDYEDISFIVNGSSFACFATAHLLGRSEFIRNFEHQALLVVKHVDRSLVDAFFLPVNNMEIAPGDELVAEINNEFKVLGKLRLFHKDIKIFVADIDGGSENSKNYTSFPYDVVRNKFQSPGPEPHEIKLFVKSKHIGTLIPSGSKKVYAKAYADSLYYKISPLPTAFLDPDDVEGDIEIRIKMVDSKGDELVLPFAYLRIDEVLVEH